MTAKSGQPLVLDKYPMTIRRFMNIVENATPLMELMVSPPQWQGIDKGLVVAYRENIWVITDDNFEDLREAICKGVGIEPDDLHDKYDLRATLSENRPDVFCAFMKNHNLYLDHYVQLNPTSSVLLKKVFQALRIQRVFQEKLKFSGEDDEYEFHPSDNKGRIPDVVYHGTNSEFIKDIFRVGIAPNDTVNFPKIGKFEGRVYFSARLADACYHANRQAEQYKSTPLVIATRIPDRSLIALDYDVGTDFYGDDHPELDAHGYTDAFKKTSYGYATGKNVQKMGGKTDYTRETGIFAYKGRVPVAFFQYVLFPTGEELDSEAKKIPPTASAIYDAIDRREYGDDYEPEDEYDPEDDE